MGVGAEDVVAGAAIEDVDPVIGLQHVVAIPAIELVVALIALERVVAGTAVELIVAQASPQHIIAAQAVEDVVAPAVAAVEEIVCGRPRQPVGKVGADDVLDVAVNDVAIGLAAGRGQGGQVDGDTDAAVVPVAERVDARAAEQLVRPGASEQLVIAGAAVDQVVAFQPPDPIVAGIALVGPGQLVVVLVACDIRHRILLNGWVRTRTPLSACRIRGRSQRPHLPSKVMKQALGQQSPTIGGWTPFPLPGDAG
jgi:hypothetical protein